MWNLKQVFLLDNFFLYLFLLKEPKMTEMSAFRDENQSNVQFQLFVLTDFVFSFIEA